MSNTKPILVWIRRDLRLTDHPALHAACESGAPVIAVFIRDASVDDLGAAPKWRLGAGLAVFARALEAKGGRLILRSGDAETVLDALVRETDAQAVHWMRAYDPASIARDTAVKSMLKERGIAARSFAGHVLFEPWTVETKTGGYYKVYTPFWKSVKDRTVATPLPAPSKIPAPDEVPESETLADWHLGAAMRRGADIVARHARMGEQAAQDRLAEFIDHWVADYQINRDLPAIAGTSNLSENLALGEISAQQCWHAGMRARLEGKNGAEIFLKEVVWRDFAYHLMYHTPRILNANWKPDWDAFPWNEDESSADVIAWQRGLTGIPFVDAAMREMYVTGRMHNRGRMIVASYLTKHLMCHWKIGLKWFEDCLIDWDPAANAMGWQWSAGSGPDATPYFRVFNPETQVDKFDRNGAYRAAWIAEGYGSPTDTALSYFEAVPKSWALDPSQPYPTAIVSPAQGRSRALDAYQSRGF